MPNMTSHVAAEEFMMNKKQKSMMQLKKYTGGASKKTRKDSDKCKVGQRKERHLW
jgi:hypothetical protein